MTPADYIGAQGKPYSTPNSYGQTSVEVLTFLRGHPWDEVALAYACSVQPSCIRVVPFNACIHTNAVPWRLTVYLDCLDRISSCEQEVIVGLPPDVRHAHALNQLLKERR